MDYRRRNKSVESILINAQRLKEYKSKLILFPINSKKVKPDEAGEEERKVRLKAAFLKARLFIEIFPWSMKSR